MFSNYKSGSSPKYTKAFVLCESQCMPARKRQVVIYFSFFIFELESKICFHWLHVKYKALCALSHTRYLHYFFVQHSWHHNIPGTRISVLLKSQWNLQESYLQWTLDLAGMSQLNDINWCEQEEWREEQVLTCVLYIIYSENKITEATWQMEKKKYYISGY